MGKQTVYVELSPENGKIIRIFKNNHEAVQLSIEHPDLVSMVARKVAVEEIRRTVCKRATDENNITHCEDCGKRISWYDGHMHERIPKGSGGEVSVINGSFLCPNCHLNVEHGNRCFQSSKIKGE